MIVLLCANLHAIDISLTTGKLPVSDPSISGDWTVVTIPLKRAGQLYLIEAKADTLQGDFVLDTGSPYLVLNRTYFRNGRSDQYSKSAGVNGNESAEIERMTISRFQISKIVYNEMDANVTNLGHIEDKRETKILGLIGTNMFKQCKLVLDSRANQLIVYKLNENGEPLEHETTYLDSLINNVSPEIQMPFKLCDNKIFLPVEVAGQKMNWILDSGAESNVLDAWSNKKIMKEFIVNRRINLTGSTGEKQDVLLGIVPQLRLGQESFAMQQAIVTSMKELSETCSAYIDGILGNSFLNQGIYVINFRTKEFSMYLYNRISP